MSDRVSTSKARRMSRATAILAVIAMTATVAPGIVESMERGEWRGSIREVETSRVVRAAVSAMVRNLTQREQPAGAKAPSGPREFVASSRVEDRLVIGGVEDDRIERVRVSCRVLDLPPPVC